MYVHLGEKSDPLPEKYWGFQEHLLVQSLPYNLKELGSQKKVNRGKDRAGKHSEKYWLAG